MCEATVRVWSKEDEAYPTPSLCGDGDGCVCAAGRGGSPEPCFASRAASARRRLAIRAPPAKHRADDVKARHSQRPARAPFHARTRARACRTAVPRTLGARASERVLVVSRAGTRQPAASSSSLLSLSGSRNGSCGSPPLACARAAVGSGNGHRPFGRLVDNRTVRTRCKQIANCG